MHVLSAIVCAAVTYCSRLAHDAELPAAGTATEARTWFALEAPVPWGRDALIESGLPAAVVQHVQQQLRRLGHARLQLVRREVRRHDVPGEVQLFAAEAGTGTLFRTRLSKLDDVTEVDFAALVHGETDAEVVQEPMWLVCVNGRRDRCCALFGRALFQAMREEDAEAAWQSSHLGGHRFAPTALVLPHGYQYGHLEEAHAAELLQAHRDKRLALLDHVRGRVDLSRPAQAADVALRQHLGLDALDAVGSHELHDEGGGRWRVRFETRTGEQSVEVEARPLGALPKSCDGMPVPTSWFDARVLS